MQQVPAALPCWRTTPGISSQPTLGRGFSFGGTDSTVDLSSEFDLCSVPSLPTDIPGWSAAQKSWLIGSAKLSRTAQDSFGLRASFFGLLLGEKLLVKLTRKRGKQVKRIRYSLSELLPVNASHGSAANARASDKCMRQRFKNRPRHFSED